MTELEELQLRIESNEILSPFEIIINILGKFSDNLYLADNLKKFFSPFMVCRYLSMRNSLLPYAEYLSTVYSTGRLSNIEFYKLVYQLIPKQKNIFISYIKRPTEHLNNKTDKEIINNKNEICTNLMEI